MLSPLFDAFVEASPVSLMMRVRRRIVVKLTRPIRDQELEIAIFTNLPSTDADGVLVAELYQGRWSVETLFHTPPKTFMEKLKP